jgi:hypothetical protein
MERLKDKVEWPVEIRKFIENRLKRARREESISRADGVLSTMPEVPKGTAAKLVRESRDSSR